MHKNLDQKNHHSYNDMYIAFDRYII